MANFEVVSKYLDKDINLPERATSYSAGYDLEAAEDITIPSLYQQLNKAQIDFKSQYCLEDMANITKALNIRPTLVSTGLKCKLECDMYLQLVSRSSIPLKSLLIVANSVGIIDADYYNNPGNEGEIFVQLINLSPFNIRIHKGDKIAQGIIARYDTVKNDTARGNRQGGFGSTTK